MKTLIVVLMLLSFAALVSGCGKHHIPPGQLKKQNAPGQMKKH